MACDGKEPARNEGVREIVDSGEGDAGAESGTGTGTGTGTGGTGADDWTPRWNAIYTHVFRTCRIDTCHGNGLAGLDFTSANAAWASLVDHPADPPNACGKLGKLRVVPGEPENSLLYLKLDGSPPCGSQMPPGGQLPDPARERVRAWIEMGAKND